MKRRRAREYALQLLFQHDFTHENRAELISEFWKDKKTEEDIKEFATTCFKGTTEHLEIIDNIIKDTAEHWVLERMAKVDRNILRLSCYEILYRKDIPPIVSVNEALEIAKKYSSAESASFINGILDKILKQHQKVHE